MIIIENQPITFDGLDECSQDIEFAQLVDNIDTTQFQVILEVCEGAGNQITDPHFNNDDGQWVLGDNWSTADNLLCHTAGFMIGMSSTIALYITRYYQVIIVVDSISFGAQFQVLLGAQVIGTISTVGTFIFYGFPIDFFGVTGVVIVPLVDGDMCISEIDVYEVATDLGVTIKDLAGVQVFQFSYFTNPSYFTLVQNYMTISVNWADFGIANGCYVLCLSEPCTFEGAEISNCDFDGNADGWTIGESWTYSDGAVVGVFDEEFEAELSQSNVFVVGQEYCVKITVSDSTLGVVNVYFGDNYQGSISEVGEFTFTGISTNDLLRIVLVYGSITITSICPCDKVYTCDYTSNTFNFKDWLPSCTMQINACNNEDGLGFAFTGTGFTPRLRLMAKLRLPKYPAELTQYTDSAGKKGVVYYSGRKAKNLCIDAQPEYIHDFLRLLLGFDNIWIDNVLYVCEDTEYNIEPIDAYDNIGKVRILMSKKTQNIKNTNCSDSENDCNLQQEL